MGKEQSDKPHANAVDVLRGYASDLEKELSEEPFHAGGFATNDTIKRIRASADALESMRSHALEKTPKDFHVPNCTAESDRDYVDSLSLKPFDAWKRGDLVRLHSIAMRITQDDNAPSTTPQKEDSDLHSFHDACIKELYRMLDVDGSDGEYRFKWAALALSSKLRELAEVSAANEALRHDIARHVMIAAEAVSTPSATLSREQAEAFAQAEVEDFRQRAAGMCEQIAEKREQSAKEYVTACPSKASLSGGATALRAAAFQIREKPHNVCYDSHKPNNSSDGGVKP